MMSGVLSLPAKELTTIPLERDINAYEPRFSFHLYLLFQC
jgi:hypothetical protein